MGNLHYTFRGKPITPYRPQRSKGPGKITTAIIVILLVCGLLYGAWEVYDSMSEEEEEQTSTAHELLVQEKPAPVETQPPVEPVQPAREPVKEPKVAVIKSTELTGITAAFNNEIVQLIKSNKLEDARRKLQTYFQSHPSTHNYYGYAQKNLAYCTSRLFKSGELKNTIVHVVSNREFLSTIAKKYGVSMDDIVKASQLQNPDRLKINQKLQIPVKYYGFLDRANNTFLVYQADKLLWVFSLKNIPESTRESFYFDHNNQAFWQSCGLTDSDWTILKALIPAKLNTKMLIRYK